MRKFLGSVFLTLALAACATPPGPATILEKANVLPLALNDNFQFRKTKLHLTQDGPEPETTSEWVAFERQRLSWGAISSYDVERLRGNYFMFFWRTRETADVTIRLEYRQAALGTYVMAQERYYPGARGSFQSSFEVTGDGFLEFGRVTAWRVLLIVDGKIVALRQSYIWK